MKGRILVVAFFLLCAVVPFASAEDGAPNPVSKPANCVDIKLIGAEDYIGSPGSNVSQCVQGGDGSNQIWVFGGPDWANGIGGQDQLQGGDAQDQLYGGKSGDIVNGEAGDDFLYTGCPGGCDQRGQNARDILRGQEGDDVIGAANNVFTEIHCGSGNNDKVYFDKGLDDVDSDCEWKAPQ